ncbi:ATP-binding cassette domain-containing protein [Cryptosporangium aurantiacum]|uniref:ABC-type dipeptide/oligopeptide/nickel transport system, ATPase component n=1 Tax=Cryptosporangium aurantiacum TaxID=134849 RepID=A0A1M7K9M4_9ACTN|nr:ABC transporter ATP-binding protein [Cryptosporangium aurantiacum]SHM61966.1 ABC-type dipeptide/oligopeptide/nickel transport system, ATPase component [Cryptosporangium aurantiacum]
MSLLEVEGLTVRIGGRPVVSDVSLTLDSGDRLGLIGASGSGKSLTALAILGLLPDGAVVNGSVRLDGTELIGLGDRALSRIRGRRVAMVFQEPQTALNPLMRIGRQIGEPLRLHAGLSRRAAAAAAVELAAEVGLPDPDRLVHSYPHELSGGQRQRVGLAIGLACRPALLLADEPTTALDVTVQAGVLRLLDRLVDDHDTALLFISHDLAVVHQVCRRVAVLADGRVLEEGTVTDIVQSPQHEGTRALIAAARATSWVPGKVLAP